MEQEYKDLQEEGERIRKNIEDFILFVNHIEGEERDEFWTLIMELVNNEIEQEKFCNQ